MTPEADLVRSLLPWRHPFVMVDGMTECVPHERIVTWKTLASGETMTPGLGSGGGSFPSALVLEGLSQSAALLFQLSYGPITSGRVPLLGHLKADVRGAARAGDTITYTVHAVKMTSTSGLFRGAAAVDGHLLVEAELAFSVPGEAP